MLPIVTTTLEVSDLTSVSATVGGTVIFAGAGEVIGCGVCYGTEVNPNILQNTKVAASTTDGGFTVSLTGLQPNTTYHMRAYATNAIGTGYGLDYTFTTKGSATITITGKSESKVYNAQEQSLSGYTVSIPEGVNIAATEISYSGSAAATGTNVGEYPFTFDAAHFSCSNSNYDVTFQVAPGKLTITPATATVTADNKSKTYGAADPELTATVTGAVNSETLNYTLSRATGQNAGEYAITVTLGSNPNYEVTPTNGTFAITATTPTVTTDANASNITAYTATLGGTLTSHGGDPENTTFGICWGTSANPTVSGNHVEVATHDANGHFTTSAAGLTRGTTYHTRAYATNSKGTVYGADITFTTAATGKPLVTVSAQQDQPGSSALVITGAITDDGGLNISERNLYYGTNRNTLSKVNPNSSFSYTKNGCTLGTAYYVCASAKNNLGTSYSDTISICISPAAEPCFGTPNHTDGSGKTNLFYRGGVVVYVPINNYNEINIVEKGFYISMDESEVDNHIASARVSGCEYNKVDIRWYGASDFAQSNSPTPTLTSTDVLNTKVSIANCSGTTFFQPYMVLNKCGSYDTIYGTKSNFTMWKPENMTITPNPATLTSNGSVELTANAEMTIGSYAGYDTVTILGHEIHISNSETIKALCYSTPDSYFNQVSETDGKASMDTWVAILNTCYYLKNMLGGSGTTMDWSYTWNDGSTGKTRTINTPGTYTAYGNFTLNGVTCTGSKNVTVSTAQ